MLAHIFSHLSSYSAPFRIKTERLILLSIIPTVLVIQWMHPRPSLITPFQYTLSFAIISGSVLVLLISLLKILRRKQVYYAVLSVCGMLGVNILMSIYHLNFDETFRTAYLLWIIFLPWYLDTHRDLVLFILLNSLALIYVLMITPNVSTQAYLFLMGVLLTDGFMYIIAGRYIRQFMELSQKGIYYGRIIEKLNDGVLQMDAKGTIVMANQRFCEIIGYRSVEVTGQMHISNLISRENRKVLARHLKDRKKGKSGKYEMRFVRKNGEAIWLSLSTRPHFDHSGILLGSSSIVSDITRRKAAEEALARYSRNLSRANKALESTYLELEQFARIASTDLKAPLYGMIADTKILKTHFKTGSFEMIGPLLHALQYGAKRMQALLEALWQYSSAGSRTIRFETVHTAGLIEEVRLDLLAHKRTFVMDELPDLYADRWQMKHLFFHLIQNALKFSPEHTPIHIGVKREAKKARYVFCIRDQGFGIPEAFHEHVFLIFQKGVHQGHDGIGLGLAICKKIVLNHGGDIWLESGEGKGTHVYFSLPLPQEEIS